MAPRINTKTLRRSIGPGLIILAIWMVFWWPVISADAYLYIRDLSLFAVPMKHYTVERFAAGELPMWIPYVSGGMPFLADPSNQVLYPLNVVFLLCDSIERALSVWIVLHSLIGMLTFAVLCRVLGVSRWIAAWSGVTYGLSGYVLSIGDNVNFLPAIAWVPLAIASFQLGLGKEHYRNSAIAALCLAAVVLAGDAQDAVLLAAILLLLSVMAMCTPTDDRNWRNFKAYYPALHLLLTLALAFLVTAAQVLPTLELIPVSVRGSPLEYEQVSIWSFPVARMLEFFQPYIFGSHYPTFDFLVPGFYPAKSGPWASSVYLGTIPVILAILGAAMFNRKTAPWLLVFTAALLLSFGANAPFHRWLANCVSFFATHRYPEKFIFWVTLSGCVLASFGAQALLDGRGIARFGLPRLSPITRWLAATAAIALLCWFSVYLPAKTWFWNFAFFNLNLWQARIPFPTSHLDVLMVHSALMLGVFILWLVARPARRSLMLTTMLVVAGLDLFWVHFRSVPTLPSAVLQALSEPTALESLASSTTDHPYRIYYDTRSPGPEIAYKRNDPFDRLLTTTLRDVPNLSTRGYPHLYGYLYRRDRLHPNSGITNGVQYLNGPLSPLQPTTNISFESHLLRHDPHKALTMANVRYVVTGIEPDNPAWHDRRFIPVQTDRIRNLRILENGDWLPRVILVPNAIGTEDDTSEIRTALESIADPRRQLTVVSSVAAGAEQPVEKVELSVARPSPERYEVSGLSPYRHAYLLLNESYMRDWHAAVNGHAVEVLRANLRFMAIAIGPGPFRAEFEYRSRRFYLGALLSALGLLLCAGLVIHPSFRRT